MGRGDYHSPGKCVRPATSPSAHAGPLCYSGLFHWLVLSRTEAIVSDPFQRPLTFRIDVQRQRSGLPFRVLVARLAIHYLHGPLGTYGWPKRDDFRPRTVN